MKSEQRKTQILECAKTLFSAKGYYQTQISDIQQAAGVARGTIYQYFKNKDDIFVTLLENLYRDWRAELSGKPERNAKAYENGFEVFKFRIRQTFKFFAEDPDYCNILLKVGLGLGGDFDRVIAQFDRHLVEMTKYYLLSGLKMGRIRSDINIEMVTNMIGGAFMRMAFYYGVTRKKRPRLDFDALTEDFVRTFAYGIFPENH